MAYDFYCEEVLSGRVPVERIIETDHVLAFHHTKPRWPVDIVVIPKFHTDSLLSYLDLDPSLVLEMMAVLRHVAADVVQDYGGCRLTTNFGEGQSTPHLHWHIRVDEESIA